MNKLFKLIYVNILGLFNINQIAIAREDGVKSNLESKTVITGLILIFYGYLIYLFFQKVNFANNYIILGLGFFVSTIICFVLNLTSIEPILFRNEDNEMLFAMPVSRQQVLFSKLFIIYLKNLVVVAIVMISSIISYVKVAGSITDTFGLMFFLNCTVIPFIPIVISSLLAYIDDFLKTRNNNNFLYKFIKMFVILFFFGGLFLIFINLDFTNFEVAISKFVNMYVFTFLFTYSLETENIVIFLTSLFIPVLLLYLYYVIVAKNYQRICSLLRGVKKKVAFEYKKSVNMGRIMGVFKKDLFILFHNKLYFNSSYSALIFLSIILIFILKSFNFSDYESIKFFPIYFNTFLPPILSMFVTYSNSSISAISLEKDNLQMLGTMPISLDKIVLGKWLVSIVLGLVFVLFNGILTVVFLDLESIEVLYCFLLPFISLLFVTFSSILLDMRFVEKINKEDNMIIKNRLINFVPMFLSLFIGIVPMLFPVIEKYYYNLGSLALLMVLAMIIEFIYFKINKNKLYRNLMK